MGLAYVTVHVFQHVPFEGLGWIETWLARRGADVHYTRFFQSDPLPDLRVLDLLVIMGGPMSVNDEGAWPWLRDEKAVARTAIEAGIPTLGVCLGAQIMASALGAPVYPGPHKEIGWYPVQGLCHAGTAFRFPAETTVFHWHGETFELPAGAVRLASSAACQNQAFQWGRHAIGLQFHLEMTDPTVCTLVDACRAELIPGPYVQGEAKLLDAPSSRYEATHALLSDVLTFLVDRPHDASADVG